MCGVIRIGDKNTGAGIVLGGSTTMRFCNIRVDRQGDAVDCPVRGHGKTVIAEGYPTFEDNGIPIAFHGRLCACGCALVSSMPHAGAS